MTTCYMYKHIRTMPPQNSPSVRPPLTPQVALVAAPSVIQTSGETQNF